MSICQRWSWGGGNNFERTRENCGVISINHRAHPYIQEGVCEINMVDKLQNPQIWITLDFAKNLA